MSFSPVILGAYGADHDPEARTSRYGRRTPDPRPARARARHRGAKYQVARLSRRCRLSISPRSQSGRKRCAPGFGFGYWSLSKAVKQRVKDAVSFIGAYEDAIVRYAGATMSRAFCGHIHSPIIRQIGGTISSLIAAIGSKIVRLCGTHDGPDRVADQLAGRGP